jgi:hypothetical protein
VTGNAATFSTLTFNTTVGPTIHADRRLLTFTFTKCPNVSIVPDRREYERQHLATVQRLGDRGFEPGRIFPRPDRTDLRNLHTDGLGASITCSDSVLTPGLPFQVRNRHRSRCSARAWLDWARFAAVVRTRS